MYFSHIQVLLEKKVDFLPKKTKKMPKIAYFAHSSVVFQRPINAVPLKKSAMGMAFLPACWTMVRWMKPSFTAILRKLLLSVTTVPIGKSCPTSSISEEKIFISMIMHNIRAEDCMAGECAGIGKRLPVKMLPCQFGGEMKSSCAAGKTHCMFPKL